MKNTEQCANISIVTVRKSQNTCDRSEFCTEGGFYKKNGAYYIAYEEDGDTGLGKTRVFLKISEDGVNMRRMGDFKTVINYKEDKICDTVYETPFGKMDIKIGTSRILNDLSEKGGTLKILYTLFSGEDTENEITLDVELRSEKNED